MPSHGLSPSLNNVLHGTTRTTLCISTSILGNVTPAAKQALQEHRWGDMYTHFSAEPRNRSQHGYFPSSFRLGGLLLQMLSLCNPLEHIPRHDSVWLGAAVGVCGIKEIFRSTGFDLDRMLHRPDSYSTYVPPPMGRTPHQWQKINSEIPCCSSSLMSRNHR